MLKRILLFCLILILGSSYSLSGIEWESKSANLSNSSTVEELAVNNDGDIFAATSGSGVFKSSDNGTNWVKKNHGMENLARSILSASDGNLYAGTVNGTLYKSTNNGDSWVQKLKAEGSFAMINSIKEDDMGNLYAVSGSDKVYISEDKGEQWNEISNSAIEGLIWDIAIVNEGRIFVSTMSSGIYRTTDAGASWAQVNTGLPGTDVHTLEIKDNGEIYAGLSGGDGVCKSSDNGETWIEINNGLDKTVLYDLLFIDDWLYAATGKGVYVFDGTEWTAENIGLPSSFTVTSLALGKGGVLFLGSKDGKIYSTTSPVIANETFLGISVNPEIMQTLDWGESIDFEISVFDYYSDPVEGAAVRVTENINSQTKNIVTDNQGKAVYTLTVPEGATSDEFPIEFFAMKENYDNSSLVNRMVKVVHGDDARKKWEAIDIPSTRNIRSIYAKKNGYLFYGVSGTGIYRSTDNGATWEIKNNGMEWQINSPSDFKEDSKGYLYTATDWDGLLMSTDDGDNWTGISGEMSRASKVYVNSYDELFLITYDPKVYKSDDLGENWSEIDFGENAGLVRSLLINSEDNIYALSDDEIILSTDRGASWETTANYPEGATFQSMNMINNSLYVCAGKEGMYKSDLLASSWKKINTNTEDLDFKYILIDENGNFYASIWSKGVYISTDEGVSWSEYNNGFEEMSFLNMYAMALSPDGYIYAGAFDKKLYRRQLGGNQALNKLSLRITPETLPEMDWNESVDIEIISLGANDKVEETVSVSIIDGIMNTTKEITTDSEGRATYGIIVPSGISDGEYEIKFNASKEGMGTSIEYVKNIIVNHSNSVEEHYLIDKINIYPNPASENLNIALNLKSDARVALSIFDIRGQKIFSKDYGKLSNGEHAARLQFPEIQAGFYIIKIEINNQIKYRNLLILR